MQGKKIVVANAFRKKQQRLPQKEKNTALKNKADYERRVMG
jgi:phage-related protein